MLTGLIGLARSGKDTVCGLMGAHRFAFADPLKDAFAEYHNIPRCWCDGVDEDGTPIDRETVGVFDLREEVEPGCWNIRELTIRQGLQRFGVAMRKQFGADFWVNRTRDRILEHGVVQDGVVVEPTVITDVRFENEVDFVVGMGGRIVLIERPGVEPVAEHVSEELAARCLRGEFSVDHWIVNDGTLKDLRTKVEEMK